ncbi:DUF4181 domain-containing protein [Fredinandcohnia humi]
MVIYYISIAIVLILLSGWGEKYLRKKFSIKKRDGFFYKPVTAFQGLVEWVLLIGFILIFWKAINDPIPYLIGFFVILFGFRSFMEWKHARESRRYILTLFTAVPILLIWIAFYFFRGMI